jgi:hypothetical protein
MGFKNGSLTALVALVVGLIIYVCFYPESIWLNSILQTNINESLNLSLPYQVPTTLVYSIPTGLWAYSFIVILFTISSKLDYSFYAAISVIFLPELLQHSSVNLIPGTFDYRDLIANLTGVTVAIFLSVKTN